MAKQPDDRRPYDPAKAARDRNNQENPAPVVTAQERWAKRSWLRVPTEAPKPAEPK